MVHVFYLVLVINFWCNFHDVTFLKMDINSALNPLIFPTEHEEDLEIRTAVSQFIDNRLTPYTGLETLASHLHYFDWLKIQTHKYLFCYRYLPS